MMTVARRQAGAATVRSSDEDGAAEAAGAAPVGAAAAIARGGGGGPPAAGDSTAAFSSRGGGLVSLTVNELEGDGGRSEIDVAVILDRSLDLVTPLFTPVSLRLRRPARLSSRRRTGGRPPSP